MHECIFTDRVQHKNGVTTLDIAKRLLDYGYHPPTIYFPLVVSGALMIEPTETETPETLDGFLDAMLEIAREAKEDPELVKNAPYSTPVRRLDEARSACVPAGALARVGSRAAGRDDVQRVGSRDDRRDAGECPGRRRLGAHHE